MADWRGSGKAWLALADLCRAVAGMGLVGRWFWGLLLAWVLLSGIVLCLRDPTWFLR